MKKLIAATLVLTVISLQVFGVAAKRISANAVTFYNWSGSAYDLNNHYLSIATAFFLVNNLNVQKTGSNLVVQPGDSITFDGLNLPASAGSIALWYPGTDTTAPTASNMVDFAQWGAAGQAFESLANTAGIWTTGTFISGTMPFVRTDFTFTTQGATVWSEDNTSTGIASVFIDNSIVVAPNPVADQLSIRTALPGENKFRLFDITGKLLIDRRIENAGAMEIATESLSRGTYILQVATAEGEVLTTRKLLKQ